MSSYRSPATGISNYITPEGERSLSEELQRLWKTERPQVTRAVADAAALGDRSENADYIYGKKRLREIDRRVRFLRKRLEQLKVVDQLPKDQSRIYFGAWVTLGAEDGTELRIRLVGPDEIDPARHHISIDSPMGKALLGKTAAYEFQLTTPSGVQHYEVLTIEYLRN